MYSVPKFFKECFTDSTISLRDRPPKSVLEKKYWICNKQCHKNHKQTDLYLIHTFLTQTTLFFRNKKQYLLIYASKVAMLFTFFILQNIDQNERIHKAVKNNSAQIEKQKRQVRVKNIPNHTISAARMSLSRMLSRNPK